MLNRRLDPLSAPWTLYGVHAPVAAGAAAAEALIRPMLILQVFYRAERR